MLADRGIDIDDIGLRRPTLDEVFLTLTGATTTRSRLSRAPSSRHPIGEPDDHHHLPDPQPAAVAPPTGHVSPPPRPPRIVGAHAPQVLANAATDRRRRTDVGDVPADLPLRVRRRDPDRSGRLRRLAHPRDGGRAPACSPSGAVGVADDIESGLFDRLRSLPIPRSSILLGRSLADTALIIWSTAITVALGYATGFRFHGSVSTRSPRSRCASCSAPRSRGRSSSWDWSRVRRRPRKGCRSWPSRSCSSPAPTCRWRRCPDGCSRSPRPAVSPDGRRGAGPGPRRPRRSGARAQRRLVRGARSAWTVVIVVVFATLAQAPFRPIVLSASGER